MVNVRGFDDTFTDLSRKFAFERVCDLQNFFCVASHLSYFHMLEVHVMRIIATNVSFSYSL